MSHWATEALGRALGVSDVKIRRWVNEVSRSYTTVLIVPSLKLRLCWTLEEETIVDAPSERALMLQELRTAAKCHLLQLV